MLGDSRDDRADLRITHGPGDVLAVQPDIVEAAVLNRWRPNRNLSIGGDPGERLLVLGRNAGSQRGKGNGPVQGSGVEEQRAQAVRQQAGHGRFSGGGWTIDGDHSLVTCCGRGDLWGVPHAPRTLRETRFVSWGRRGALDRSWCDSELLPWVTRAPLEVERLQQGR